MNTIEIIRANLNCTNLTILTLGITQLNKIYNVAVHPTTLNIDAMNHFVIIFRIDCYK